MEPLVIEARGSAAYAHHMRLWPTRKIESERPTPRTIWSAQVGPDGLSFSGAGLQAADALLEQLAGLTTERISRADALKATAVLRARNLIAGVSATLPIDLRDARRRLVFGGCIRRDRKDGRHDRHEKRRLHARTVEPRTERGR